MRNPFQQTNLARARQVVQRLRQWDSSEVLRLAQHNEIRRTPTESSAQSR